MSLPVSLSPSSYPLLLILQPRSPHRRRQPGSPFHDGVARDVAGDLRVAAAAVMASHSTQSSRLPRTYVPSYGISPPSTSVLSAGASPTTGEAAIKDDAVGRLLANRS
jgi:hypothetical protein